MTTRYAESPVDSRGITKGKRYPITNWAPKTPKYGHFRITDNEGFSMYCLIGRGCAYLDGATWIIIEEEETSNDN